MIEYVPLTIPLLKLPGEFDRMCTINDTSLRLVPLLKLPGETGEFDKICTINSTSHTSAQVARETGEFDRICTINEN